MTNIKGAKKGASGGAGFKEDPNTLTTNTVVKSIYMFSEGPVEGLATGDGKSLYFNDVPLIDSEGDNTHEGVSWTFRNGLPDQEHIPGFDSVSTISAVSTQVLFTTPVTQSIVGNYDAVNVTISIPSLNDTDSTSGTLKGTDLSFAIDVKTATGSYVTVHNINLVKQKTTSEYRATYRVDLPEGGSPYQVRVRRLTPDSASITLQNDLYFATYATVIDGKFSYRNSCIMGLLLPAKEFDSQVPSIKARIKGIKVWVPKNYDPIARTYATSGVGTSGGIWDGTFKAAYTNNPAWIFNDLLINDRYGLGQDFNVSNDPESALVDKWSLYTISQFCDETVSDGYGGTEPRYTINTQITDKQEAYDLLQEIMSSMNGMIYFASDQIVPVIDKPDVLDDIFTQSDVVDGLFEYSGTALKTRHSAVISYYNDPNNLFRRSVVVHEDPELISQIGYRSVEINNFGCTSRAQALRAARWMLETEKNQTQTVTFKVGDRGGFLTPGAVIKIFDDYKAGARMGGRILEYSGTSPNFTFTLDQNLVTASGDTFIYINEDGIPVTCAITTSNSDSTISINNGNGPPVVGGVFALIKPSLDGQLYRILQVIEEDDQYTVIALQHNESKFGIIEADPIFGDLPTSIINSKKIPTVTDIDITQWWETVSGTEPFPHITVSWVRPNDYRVVGFEVQLKTPTLDYYLVYSGAATSWNSDRLQSSTESDYSVRIRCYDAFGKYSEWAYDTQFDVPGKNTAPPVPDNFEVTPIINGYVASWDNPDIPDFKYVEVKEGLTNVLNDAQIVSTASNDFYVRQGLLPYNERYVWVRTVSHAATNNVSSWLGPLLATAKGVNIADFDDEVAGIPIVDVLPNPVGYIGPPIVFLTSDQKLYTYKDGDWALTVADIPEDFNPGIPGFSTAPATSGYTEGQTYFNTTDGKLYRLTSGSWVAITADADAAIPVGASLPSSGMSEGDLYYLTTDDKLYRYTGSVWTASLAATDITGTITTTQITNDAITTAKIATDAVTAGKILAGSITTVKLAANAVTANEIAANAITAGKIAANAISATEIQSGAITTAKLNANVITSNELAANAVTAGKIAAGAVTANAIGAGTITVAINLGSSAKIVLDGANNRIIISD